MPIAKLLKTKAVFIVREFEDDKKEKSVVSLAHCWVPKPVRDSRKSPLPNFG